MQSSKIRRQVYFESEIKKQNLDAIKVVWYVTFNEQHNDLPLYVEASLLQQYYEKHKILPEWNNQA